MSRITRDERTGYFGIGIYSPKREQNVGTLYRSAASMGASMTFQVGGRFQPQCSDTTKAYRMMPHFEFADDEQLLATRPYGAQLVVVELHDEAVPLATFEHPRNAIYLLGAEDNGVPARLITAAQHVVQLPGEFCLNVATAGSIVLYDRVAKAGAR